MQRVELPKTTDDALLIAALTGPLFFIVAGFPENL
jgi:hypothetical protein